MQFVIDFVLTKLSGWNRYFISGRQRSRFAPPDPGHLRYHGLFYVHDWRWGHSTDSLDGAASLRRDHCRSVVKSEGAAKPSLESWHVYVQLRRGVPADITRGALREKMVERLHGDGGAKRARVLLQRVDKLRMWCQEHGYSLPIRGIVNRKVSGGIVLYKVRFSQAKQNQGSPPDAWIDGAHLDPTLIADFERRRADRTRSGHGKKKSSAAQAARHLQRLDRGATGPEEHQASGASASNRNNISHR